MDHVIDIILAFFLTGLLVYMCGWFLGIGIQALFGPTLSLYGVPLQAATGGFFVGWFVVHLGYRAFRKNWS